MLTVFRIVFAVLCFGKAIDIATRGPSSIGTVPALLIGAAWALAAAAMGFGYAVKICAGVIIALAAVVSVLSKLDMYNQHLYLIASICAILIIDQSVPTLLKAQLSISYAFAALSKVNEAFLSGTVIYVSAVQRPFWQQVFQFEPSVPQLIGLSATAICVEGFLAVGFWFRPTRYIALVIGVGFHLGMLVLMSSDVASLLRLSIFGFLMMCLYIPFFQPEIDRLLETEERGQRHRTPTVAWRNSA